jgi:selenide, water dikinase
VTSQQLEKRRRVMKRSMALGHCICDVRQPCPCEPLRQRDICHCAGERPPAQLQEVRLTEHVRNAGCASKISKGVLREVLEGLAAIDDPRVVVGSAAGDDAGVMLLSPGTASILTVDVFSPPVDDPYIFGQIAAANSLSDIYAMGGTPQAALSIIGFPINSLPASAMREILRGGTDKMKEAGVPVVGGHSINDQEPKCGFAVLGTAPADGYVRNAGARAGDAIVLTKPLGGGIAIFAHQVGRLAADHLQPVSVSMAMLNRIAGELMVRHGAHAATDVTGFSLLGHMAEIVRNSDVETVINFDAIPLFDAVAGLARQEILPGAVERNREAVEESMLDLQLAPAQQAILFGPETSGGLLIFLPHERAAKLIDELRERGIVHAAIIGQVTQSRAGGLIRARTAGAEGFAPISIARAPREAPAPAAAAGDGARGPADDAQPTQAAGAPDPAAAEPCCCAEPAPAAAHSASPAPSADGDAGLPAPFAADAFKAYMAAVSAPGALDTKHKKLISLALSVATKCEPCIRINARAAREAGASEQELSEAVALACAFGGAPVTMFYNTVRRR